MTKMTHLAFYLSTLSVMSSCSESTDSEKRTSGTGVNPYAGVDSESTPSDISGAWLVRCDIESFGVAVNSENDTLYCRTNDEAGKKSPREISFVDSALKAVKELFKEDLPESSLYTAKYQVPTQLTKNYNDLRSPEKTLNLNYQIIDKTKFKWSAITDPLVTTDVADLIAAYATKLDDIDEIFCDSNGELKANFEITLGGTSLKKSTTVVSEANSCFIPTSVLPNFDSFTGTFDVVKDKLVSGAKGTGCQVTILFNKLSLKTIRFAILDKKAVSSSFNSPNDMTQARLKSTAYAGQCGFPSGLEALKNITP